MKGFRLLAITLSLAVSGGFAHAQMTGQDARAEGRDLWEEAKAKAMAAGKPVRRTEL